MRFVSMFLVVFYMSTICVFVNAQDGKPFSGIELDGVVPANSYKDNNLKIYLELSAANNPGLKLHLKIEIGIIGRSQSQALSDPKFTFTYFIEEIETRLGPQRGKVSVSQSFPCLVS